MTCALTGCIDLPMAPSKPTQAVDYVVHGGGAVEKWGWEWDRNDIEDGDHDKRQTWAG